MRSLFIILMLCGHNLLAQTASDLPDDKFIDLVKMFDAKQEGSWYLVIKENFNDSVTQIDVVNSKRSLTSDYKLLRTIKGFSIPIFLYQYAPTPAPEKNSAIAFSPLYTPDAGVEEVLVLIRGKEVYYYLMKRLPKVKYSRP